MDFGDFRLVFFFFAGAEPAFFATFFAATGTAAGAGAATTGAGGHAAFGIRERPGRCK